MWLYIRGPKLCQEKLQGASIACNYSAEIDSTDLCHTLPRRQYGRASSVVLP